MTQSLTDTLTKSFDQTISREGSQSLKYEGGLTIFGSNEVMAMWVPDMNFAIPDPISTALKVRAKHHVFGYSIATDSLYQALMNWLLAKHSWQIRRDWIVLTPSVVPSLNLVVAALTVENAGIFVQSLVYFLFFSAVINQNRRLIENPLVLKVCRNNDGECDGFGNLKYQMDFEQLDSLPKRQRCY